MGLDYAESNAVKRHPVYSENERTRSQHDLSYSSSRIVFRSTESSITSKLPEGSPSSFVALTGQILRSSSRSPSSRFGNGRQWQRWWLTIAGSSGLANTELPTPERGGFRLNTPNVYSEPADQGQCPWSAFPFYLGLSHFFLIHLVC